MERVRMTILRRDRSVPSGLDATPEFRDNPGVRRPLLVSSFLVVAMGAAIWAWTRAGRVAAPPPADPAALEPLAVTPRPPVASEPRQAVLRRRPSPRPAAAGATREALVTERNELARAHRDLVAGFEAGLVGLRDVERAELLLLDARRRIDEIDDATWHRERAVVLAREAERIALSVDAGMAPPIEGEVARLALERERALGGASSDYPAKREAFFRALAERNAGRMAMGLVAERDVREEREAWEAEFPP
jgi:hypothetical protein